MCKTLYYRLYDGILISVEKNDDVENIQLMTPTTPEISSLGLEEQSSRPGG